MNINMIVSGLIVECLHENMQLADKVYFNTSKLTKEDRDVILRITGGNNYTKIISDFYYFFKEGGLNLNEIEKRLKVIYNEVVSYNKNVFPIIGYDINNISNIHDVIYSLEKRRKILDNIKKLPSFAIRNLKGDIRSERNLWEFDNYMNDLDYFMSHYSYLSNRNKDIQEKILKKMFKNNTTLDDLMRFVDEKSNFIGGVEFTRDDIKELSKTEDFEIIYEQNNIMIVRVDSPQGIKAIGCNSLWCFTYGSGFDNAYRQWNNYSHNDMVYVIVNFGESSDSEEFMHVLIKPLIDEDGNLIVYDQDNEDEYPIYNMSNENDYNPYGILKHLFGDGYENIVHNYLNFEY